MSIWRKLRKNERGSPAVEFALISPILFTFILGIIQLGILFSAYAGMASAVNEGARYATVYPTPTDAQIIARANAKKFMLQSAYLTGPTVTHGTSNGVSYAEVTMSYNVPLNFVLFTAPPVTLSQTRRAYTAS